MTKEINMKKSFMKKKNKELLWDLCSQNKEFETAFSNDTEHVKLIFEETLQAIVRVESYKSLMHYNKAFLAKMTSQCQNGIFQPNDKNDKSEATEQEKILSFIPEVMKDVSAEKIKEERRVSFEKQMEERQKEFFSMHKRQLPEEINFCDVERDAPIENIDSLMTQKLNERKYDTPIGDASVLDNDTIDVVSSEQSDVKMIKKDNIQWLNQIHDTNINETPIFEPRTNETMNNTLATQLQAAEKIIEQLNTIQMQNYDSMNQTLLGVMERLGRAEEIQKEILQKVDLLQDKVEI